MNYTFMYYLNSHYYHSQIDLVMPIQNLSMMLFEKSKINIIFIEKIK